MPFQQIGYGLFGLAAQVVFSDMAGNPVTGFSPDHGIGQRKLGSKDQSQAKEYRTHKTAIKMQYIITAKGLNEDPNKIKLALNLVLRPHKRAGKN